MRLFKRPPDFVVEDGRVGEDATRTDVYLRRWFIWPRNQWFNAYLHRFGASDDDRAVHDHPAWNISIILSGRYREHFHDGTSRVRRPGQVIFRGAKTLHRLELLTPTVTTIWISGPKRRVWGFLTPSHGWIPYYRWEAYLAATHSRGMLE